MTEEEFGRLSFKTFNALVNRKADIEERNDVRMASIIAAIFNSQPGRKKSQMLKVDDILGKKKEVKLKSQDEMMLEVMKIMHVFGGIDKRST